MVRLSKEDDGWYLTDGTEAINVSDLLPEYEITSNTKIAEVVGNLRRSQRLASKEEDLLKRWEEARRQNRGIWVL